MFKRLILFALLAALILPAFGQEETKILLGNLMKPKLSSYAFALDQNLRTTDSPTFAGLTLSGSTASTLAYLNGSKKFTSLANGAGYLLNNGSGTLSWAAVDLSAYLKADRSVAMTGVTGPILVYLDADEKFASLANATGFLYNNGSGTLSYDSTVDADTLDGSHAAAFSLSGHNHTGTYEPALGNPAASGYLLASTDAGVRSWYNAAGAYAPMWAGRAVGDLIYANAATTVTGLPAVATGQVLTSAGLTTAPAWSDSPTLTGTLTANNLTADPTLGSELTTLASWTDVAGWEYTTKWTHSAGDTTTLTETVFGANFVVGSTYKIVVGYTWAGAGSTITFSAGGITFYEISSAAASSVTYYVTASAATAFKVVPTTGFTGSIDSCSIKLVTNGNITSGNSVLDGSGLVLPLGNLTYPAIQFANRPTSGIYYDAQYDRLRFAVIGSSTTFIDSTYFRPTSIYLGITNTILRADNSNELQIGIDAASPADQTFKACDGVGTNKIGATLTLQGGQSTGTGTSGSLNLQTAYTSTTGSAANTYYTRQYVDAKVHTVNNNTATAMFSIACADGNVVGGYINYTVEVTDGTDFQVESGTFTFAGVNKATETWTSDADKGTVSQAASSGTLTVTWAVDTATADTLKVTVNSNSSLTPTSSKVQFQIFLNSPKVITIL